MAKRKRSAKEQPIADRARDAGEELGSEAPVVTHLADERKVDEEGMAAATAAGITAAGESDRPAGVHVAPEYPVEEVPAEFDVDAVYTIDGEEQPPGLADRLESLADLPDEPLPLEAPIVTGPFATEDLSEEGFALDDEIEDGEDEAEDADSRKPRAGV